MELDQIPSSWRRHVRAELSRPYMHGLRAFLREEREEHVVYPPEAEVFSALALTPYERVRVVLLGQDPYHGPGQAHGLAFSVRPGVRPPPSLMNVFRELKEDLGCAIPKDGYLTPWAEQGVLLLNAVLTVRKKAPNSHRGKGWEQFTDAILRAVNEKPGPVVFLLWGAYAQKKAELVDPTRHVVLAAAHPSPFSARRGFFGSHPFSRTNAVLAKAGEPPIDWCLPETA